MKEIARGAEAVLSIGEMDGQKVLVKERIRKGYRLRQIDERLRKTRTKAEAKLLSDARRIGVRTPRILKVEEDKIVMEFVDGVKVKDVLGPKSAALCVKIGEAIGRLHAANIIHGDLTTSNMILSKDEVYFVDFGLGGFSKRIEDKATDLKLLHEALTSTHWKVLKQCWGNILKGYKREYRDAPKVLGQIGEIEKRARYAKR